MTNFPDSIYEPREKENRSGVVYDPVKKTVGFAEDVTKLDDEVVAIEDVLGVEPQGSLHVTVGERIGDKEPAQFPSADPVGLGAKIELTAVEGMAFGDACYIGSDGKAHLADASVIATANATVLCLETLDAEDSGSFLMIGTAKDTSWDWTVGGLIYLSITGTTGNTLSQSLPTEEDEVVQILGIAISADSLYFLPQLPQIELA